MNIVSLNAFFVYKGGYKLDLMSPPPPTESILYSQYLKLIDSVSSIYGEQRPDGTIPVFYTKQRIVNSAGSNQAVRVPDENSTLKELVPGRAYYFVPRSQQYLPVNIPQTLNFFNFIQIDEKSLDYLKYKELISLISSAQPSTGGGSSIGIQSVSTLDCCPKIVVKELVNNKVIINGFKGVLKIQVNNLIPDENYYYFLEPVFSNWPIKISPLKGSIKKSGPTNADGFVSATISLFYTTYKTTNDADSDSFSYSLPDPKKYRYYEQDNILSTVNISIVHSDANKCLPVSKIFDINPVLPDTVCQKIKLFPSGTVQLGQTLDAEFNTKQHIHGVITNLDPDNDYKYYFRSKSASWPANIKPISGILNPSNRDNGVAYVHGLFSFCASGSVDSCSNLDYEYVAPNVTLTASQNNENQSTTFIRTISPNIYSNLELVVEPLASGLCSGVSQDVSIVCKKCMPYNDIVEYVVNSGNLKHEKLSVSIDTLQDSKVWPFNKQNAYQFPFVFSATSRPLAEINVSGQSCKEGIPLKLFVSGVVSGEKYDCDWNSYIPGVNIIPKTSTVTFNHPTGMIIVSGYLNDNSSAPIDVLLTHQASQVSVSDFAIIRCYQPWVSTDPKTSYQPALPAISLLSSVDEYECLPVVTPSMTRTLTPTPTITRTSTVTPTVTRTSTLTPTVTRTVTPTPTLTPSVTPTTSVTPTMTVTPTITVTSTVTVTPTITITKTVTPTISVTPTNTVTPTVTMTPPNSPTPTCTVTPTRTVTPTISVTPTLTPTNTVTPTVTTSVTATRTATPTVTPTNTATPTVTPTRTVTPTVTPTNTLTPTMTVTPSQTPTFDWAPRAMNLLGGNLTLNRTYYYKVVGENVIGTQNIYGGNDPTILPFGSDIYGWSSILSIAVVHAGIVERNQIGVIKITILPGMSYQGITRNNITSRTGSEAYSILIEPYFTVSSSKRAPVPDPVPDPASDPTRLLLPPSIYDVKPGVNSLWIKGYGPRSYLYHKGFNVYYSEDLGKTWIDTLYGTDNSKFLNIDDRLGFFMGWITGLSSEKFYKVKVEPWAVSPKIPGPSTIGPKAPDKEFSDLNCEDIQSISCCVRPHQPPGKAKITNIFKFKGMLSYLLPYATTALPGQLFSESYIIKWAAGESVGSAFIANQTSSKYEDIVDGYEIKKIEGPYDSIPLQEKYYLLGDIQGNGVPTISRENGYNYTPRLKSSEGHNPSAFISCMADGKSYAEIPDSHMFWQVRPFAYAAVPLKWGPSQKMEPVFGPWSDPVGSTSIKTIQNGTNLNYTISNVKFNPTNINPFNGTRTITVSWTPPPSVEGVTLVKYSVRIYSNAPSLGMNERKVDVDGKLSSVSISNLPLIGQESIGYQASAPDTLYLASINVLAHYKIIGGCGNTTSDFADFVIPVGTAKSFGLPYDTFLNIKNTLR